MYLRLPLKKKTNKHKLTFSLKTNNITCEDNVKLLGVTIDSDLNFNNHISEICRQIKQTKKSIKAAKYFETD